MALSVLHKACYDFGSDRVKDVVSHLQCRKPVGFVVLRTAVVGSLEEFLLEKRAGYAEDVQAEVLCLAVLSSFWFQAVSLGFHPSCRLCAGTDFGTST